MRSDYDALNLEKALACFLVSDHDKDPSTEDHNTILRAWTARKHAQRLPLYLYLLRNGSDIYGKLLPCLAVLYGL